MTINDPAVVDTDAFAVRRTIRISAPIEKVWSAVTDPAHISQWFGRAEFDGSGAGATGTLTFEGEGSVPVRIERVDEPRLISYRWGAADVAGSPGEPLSEEHSTVFTFTLESVADGTELTVVETGFETLEDPAAGLESHRGGWDAELDKLVALLEGGS